MLQNSSKAHSQSLDLELCGELRDQPSPLSRAHGGRFDYFVWGSSRVTNVRIKFLGRNSLENISMGHNPALVSVKIHGIYASIKNLYTLDLKHIAPK